MLLMHVWFINVVPAMGTVETCVNAEAYRTEWWRTNWSPAGSSCHLFSVIYNSGDTEFQHILQDIVFQVSFSFSDNHFIVPWITIADGRALCKGHRS